MTPTPPAEAQGQDEQIRLLEAAKYEMRGETARLKRCEAQWGHRAEVAESALVACMSERHALVAERDKLREALIFAKKSVEAWGVGGTRE